MPDRDIGYCDNVRMGRGLQGRPHETHCTWVGKVRPSRKGAVFPDGFCQEVKTLSLLLSLLAILSGCRTESPEGACTLENFIAVAISEDVPREIPAWDKSSKYEIICRDADKVSYRTTEYQYTGGAHGSTLVRVGTVDRKTGRKYKLDDIVPETRRNELLRKVREDIAIRRYEAKSYAEWRARKEIAFFDEPQLTENFYFDDRAIHFIYNQYEIACYADGIIEAIVPR